MSAATRGGSGGEGGGLVPYSTSFEGGAPGAEDLGGFVIDTAKARMARLKSGVLTAARLIGEEVRHDPLGCRPWMLTLTYRPGEQWKPFHITECVGHIRRWATSCDFRFRYVWVAEVQQKRYRNGGLLGECVHYHLVIWVPASIVPPKLDSEGWWPWGMTQRIKVVAPISYMTKYVSKGDGVEFPKGLRVHGCGGLSKSSRNERTWWASPRWVRAIWSPSDVPRRVSGGGFFSRVTSRWFPSVYRVKFLFGSVVCSIRDDLLSFFPPVLLLRLSSLGVL